MLQALSDEGKLITPGVCTEAEIAKMRNATFYCPDCQQSVILRAGKKVTPHFSHHAVTSCSVKSQKGEGEYHRLGKIKLYQWLRRQMLYPALEVYLADIEQRPDLLLYEQGQTFAIEFQCADISQEVWQKRTLGYLRQGILPIWLIGAKRFRRTGERQLTFRHWMLLNLQQTIPSSAASICYFCPQTERFVIASDLHLQTASSAFAKLQLTPASRFSFSDIFLSSSFLTNKEIYSQWIHVKSNFRLRRNPSQGVDLDFQHWLYKQSRHREELPAIINLPNRAQHLMRLSLWQWQSYFILGFLDRLHIGESFRTEEANEFLQLYRYPAHFYPLWQCKVDPIALYLHQLANLKVISWKGSGVWVKCRAIRFFSTLDEALTGDKLVMQHLIQYTSDECDTKHHAVIPHDTFHKK